MIRRRPTLGGSVATASGVLAAIAFAIAPATAPVALAGMNSPLPAAPPTPGKCSANFVSGTIGGQPKCLAAGQQCQQAHAADYTKYGFTCAKVGNRFQLSKKGAAPPKPAPKSTAPSRR